MPVKTTECEYLNAKSRLYGCLKDVHFVMFYYENTSNRHLREVFTIQTNLFRDAHVWLLQLGGQFMFLSQRQTHKISGKFF